MNKWIEAARPRTLPVSLAGVLAGIGFGALSAGARVWADPIAWVCLGFALLAQIASNFANEYFDYRAGRDRPGREGPRRGVSEGDISPRAMLAATLLTLALACALGLCALARGGWIIFAVGVAVALGVGAYSAGPWPLSTHGLGEVAVLFFFGIIPVCGTCWLLTGQINGLTAAGSVSFGLLGANVLIVNNTRDIADDRACGKRTLAVMLGKPAMVVIYALNGMVAGGLLFPSLERVLPQWAAIIITVWVIIFSAAGAGRLRRKSGRALNPELGRTSLLAVATALVWTIAASLA